MSTKAVLVASGVILTAGVAVHHGGKHGCPLRNVIHKMHKEETAKEHSKAIKFNVALAQK